MKKILTSILCMLCLFSASMSAFEYKGINYSVVSSTEQTVTVAAPNTVSGDITIPKLVMDAATSTAYRVVSISDNAFKDCAELTSVTFKAELTSIGKSAFENTGLTSIVIPEGVTIINESTFAGCSSLTNITLSSGTTSIGKSAFANSGLTNIVIPEGVTTINESTFSGCASLASITLSSGTTSIGKSAFANSGLTNIEIPEGVIAINGLAFSGCANLTSVTIPSKLRSIGNSAFMNSGITSLDLPSTTNSIGNSAFEGCSGLKSVNYTYSKVSIGTDAFKNCAALEDLNLVFIEPYVDLGLPSGTLWATCNIGAEYPEDYGGYFAWGETDSKSTYSWSNYKWMKSGSSSKTGCTKYTFADGLSGVWYNSSGYYVGSTINGVNYKNLRKLQADDDAATIKLGSNWCMPTRAQMKELINSTYTTIEWTTVNGVGGRKITSKTNGNSIFLPAAGSSYDGALHGAGTFGSYWSSELSSYSSSEACELQFQSAGIYVDSFNRYHGLPIRPVYVTK